MSNQKNPFAAHLERKNDTGKCIAHFRGKYPNTSALTQLAAASLHRRVCCLPRRVCADASAPTRLRRRVRADASTPRRLHRRVCSDRSGPTRLRRRVNSDGSAPTRLRGCADASAPTRLHRRVCADASALARPNIDFRSKTLIPLNTSLKNSKKHQAKSPLVQKMNTPIAVLNFPR